MGKKGKKDPNAPTIISEDTFVRVSKLKDLKVAPKPPKGEFTAEEWCISPAFHSDATFKATIQYWQQCAIVKYKERETLIPPTKVKTIDDEATAKKPHPRKELQDLFKYCKTLVRQSNKRTGNFSRQLDKREGKEMKRQTMMKSIAEADSQMNEELRMARRFVERRQLFDKRFMYGSKLEEPGKGPRKNALIAIELSDKQAAWVDETKGEVARMLETVINEGECESLNIALFSGSNVSTWCPTYQSKTDPKKGLADSQKWLNKNFTAKTCSAQPYPPDFCAMFSKFTAEGTQPPWHIYLCCSKAPEDKKNDVLELVKDLRVNMDPPAKNVPLLPINIVAFDNTIDGDEEEKTFFETIAGENGKFMVDTSASDLLSLDKMLKSVQSRKKSLDKMNKKLDKMEDLSEKVSSDRELLQMQIALANMLQNDFEILDWALKNENQPVGPEI